MRIAIFDYRITPNNPIGSCHLRMLKNLCNEHEFTVFSVEFENPDPKRIHWVRIPVPMRPLAVLFILYHLLAPVYYVLHRWRKRTRFDLVQMVESNLVFGDVSYAHFCHRSYLKQHWKNAGARGLRGVLRWLDHKLHALMEPLVFRKAKQIVVPSRGLGRELQEQYPSIRSKIFVISNPVDFEQMTRPPDFDRAGIRKKSGIGMNDVVFSFVALGHFERKGLPLVMQAISNFSDSRLKLLVVGGEENLISEYRHKADELKIGAQVIFAGMQKNVKPYLWIADAFVFPSYYETFSLITLEAAAAGLPIIVSRLHGVEDYIRDGETGILVERSSDAVTKAIATFLSMSAQQKERLGRNAREVAAGYSISNFARAWRDFYAKKALD